MTDRHPIETLNAAMIELQSAVTARSLYPPGHPRIRTVEERTYGLVRELTEARQEITLFALGERIIFDGKVLPSSQVLSESLFRELGRRGVDRVTFRRGLLPRELGALLDAIAEDDADLVGSTHVGLGFIQETAAPSQERVIPSAGHAPLPAKMADVLRDAWADLHEGQPLPGDSLGDIFLSLSKALSDSSCAVLPLADVKSHDEYTFVHTINVAMLSTALGECVGFHNRLAHELSLAALLHDVGKQAIPLDLLNKKGRFTDEEFRVIQLHPVVGARMLLATPGSPELATVVAYEHHVRADGSGYPKVPRGWRLSLASRIVQVADVFDALRTHRPYRSGMPVPEIVKIMRKDIGTFFDRELLELFFKRVLARGVPEPYPMEEPEPVTA